MVSQNVNPYDDEHCLCHCDMFIFFKICSVTSNQYFKTVSQNVNPNDDEQSFQCCLQKT